MNVGDKVAWSHGHATQFGPTTVLRRSAVVAHAANHAEKPRFGIITAVANESKTNFEVFLEPTEDPEALGYGQEDTRVLTSNELVLITDD